MINPWTLVILFTILFYVTPIAILLALVYFVKNTKLRALLIVSGLLVLLIPVANKYYKYYIFMGLKAPPNR